MITLYPSLMATMDTDHLLAALACEHLTPCEIELVQRCEALIKERDERPYNDKLWSLLDEIEAQFPEEDFLDDVIHKLDNLGTEGLAQISGELLRIQTAIVNNGEYALEQLRKINEL